jgi:hypothetical protein
MFGVNQVAANAKGYRKTPMQALLNKPNVDSLRAYIRLPPTVKGARPILMLFIEANPQLQHSSPETVLQNVVQYALTFQQCTGKMLNLTMVQDIMIPLPPPDEEEEKPVVRFLPFSLHVFLDENAILGLKKSSQVIFSSLHVLVLRLCWI